MGLHHLLLSRTTSNFSLVLLQAVEDLVVLWFVLCHGGHQLHQVGDLLTDHLRRLTSPHLTSP